MIDKFPLRSLKVRPANPGKQNLIQTLMTDFIVWFRKPSKKTLIQTLITTFLNGHLKRQLNNLSSSSETTNDEIIEQPFKFIKIALSPDNSESENSYGSSNQFSIQSTVFFIYLIKYFVFLI